MTRKVLFDEVSKRWRVVGGDGSVIENGFASEEEAWFWVETRDQVFDDLDWGEEEGYDVRLRSRKAVR
jgi:hypothetical protein